MNDLVLRKFSNTIFKVLFGSAVVIWQPSYAESQQPSPPDQKVRAARAVKTQEILQSNPASTQQSQRDIGSFLKQLNKPEFAREARSAAEAREILDQIQYQRPYFHSGEERRSLRGVLNTSLAIVYDQRKIWRPDTVEVDENGEPLIVNDNPVVLAKAGVIDARLRSYEGRPVGPTLRVKPGEILRVRLKNQLPPEDPSEHPDDINTPHEFNTTNLHTHGLHVSPVGNGDNVLLSVGPGEEFIYEITVPEDHVAGTFWYHAHRHGSTAIQVSSGMAGALIVDSPENDPGAVDNVPGIKQADERICVFQQISYAPPKYAFTLLEAMDNPSEMPTEGESLIVVGRTHAGTPEETLYFRVFDHDGELIKEITDSEVLAERAVELQHLKEKIDRIL
ncbi:multicopper oxidase domain-containing protein [Allorhodopirellula heiligendammensis]|uniref:Multicopper oxidase mco n=1 Tax=Allorhodopirellula heiligendammensis TaxID=2714739 RepID=A0A5C6BDN7_9BACT|nr:multicopper oxidase domain-containing protein [Allorhodopirellula heiligendammensis]TWU10080.1 Multicopper oxidase mco [Allorhodopirellula heiligendammensis]